MSPKLSLICGVRIAEYNFFYRCGKASVDANELSRIPVSGYEGQKDGPSDEQYVRPFLDRLKPLPGDGVACTHESFQAIFQAYSVATNGEEPVALPAVEVVGARPEAGDSELPADPIPPEPWNLNLIYNWAELQKNDPTIANVLRYLGSGKPPAGSELKRANAEVVQLIKEWDRLVIRNNVLLRRRLTDGH